MCDGSKGKPTSVCLLLCVCVCMNEPKFTGTSREPLAQYLTIEKAITASLSQISLWKPKTVWSARHCAFLCDLVMFINALEASDTPPPSKPNGTRKTKLWNVSFTLVHSQGKVSPLFVVFLFKYVYIVQDRNDLYKGMRLFYHDDGEWWCIVLLLWATNGVFKMNIFQGSLYEKRGWIANLKKMMHLVHNTDLYFLLKDCFL